MSKMTLKTEGDTQVIVTRHFAAPPEAVYRAHTDPKLIQKWLLGRKDGRCPYASMSLGQVASSVMSGPMAKAVISNHWRIRGTGALQQDRTRRAHALADRTPDNHIETRFEADGAGTLMTMRMTLPDAKTRAAMLATGMERGMGASYDRLAEFLMSLSARGIEKGAGEL